METKQKIGKDMTAEEIGKVLLDAGVSPGACERTVRILIRNGYVRVVPDAVVARINGKIDFMFGNHEFAGSFSLTENSEELDFVYSISTPSNTGRFVYSIENQKEDDVQKHEDESVSDVMESKFRKQLEAAKLSEQSTEVILKRLFAGNGLKTPEVQSVLICTKGPSVTNVYYSHDGSPVTLTDIEYSRRFEDDEILSCGTGTHDAFFIVDTSNVKTFKEKMIYRHAGVPKITLNLSNGNSYGLPFKKTYHAVSGETVAVELDCKVIVNLSNKALNNPSGPAVTDLNEVDQDRFFVNGTEYTLEEFNQMIATREQESAFNPGAGSWADIE